MSKSSRRYYRSLIISLGSLGVLVWVVFDEFEVPREEVAALVFGTVGVMVAVILLAAICAGILIAIRRWSRRGREE